MEGNARVADYILKERLDRLPEAVLARAKLCVLDLAGATLGGCRARGAEILTEFVLTAMVGAPEATILRSGRRVPMASAALANGFMTNALDIDDGYRPIVGHPGAVVFPAILAVAERQGASGAALLESLVVGYEVAIRAGLIMREHYGAFHCSGSWGAIGAAAACGRLLRLDAERLAHALGIAESHAPLLPTLREVGHPAMTKDGVAWGAFVGVTAALLAARGFTGMPAVFADARHNAPVATLGERYEILHVYFKPYPCCRWFQPAIAAVQALAGRHAIRAESIARIEVATFRAALDARVRAPRTQEEAEYSLPYCVAAVAVHGDLGPGQVSDGGWEDPRVLDLAGRIDLTLAPDLESRFPAEALARVAIVTRDGRRIESDSTPARGGPENPLTPVEIREKFARLVAETLSPDKAAALAAALERIEQLPDARALVALMEA
jgi:2-methylcitrate dehydratase PrpD